MARPPVYSDDDRQALLTAFHQAGSIDGALERLRVAGRRVPSHGWAHKVLTQAKPTTPSAAPRPPAPAPPKPPAADWVKADHGPDLTLPAPTPIEPKDEAPDAPEVILRRMLASLEAALADAMKDGNRRDVSNLSKAMGQTMALASRLAPPPRTSSDDAPDMVVAAAEARELLRKAFERA